MNITVTKSRRIHAIVNEEVQYQIKQSAIDAIMQSTGKTRGEAIAMAVNNGPCERLGYSNEVDEVIAEHECSITED